MLQAPDWLILYNSTIYCILFNTIYCILFRTINPYIVALVMVEHTINLERMKQHSKYRNCMIFQAEQALEGIERVKLISKSNDLITNVTNNPNEMVNFPNLCRKLIKIWKPYFVYNTLLFSEYTDLKSVVWYPNFAHLISKITNSGI